MKNSKRILAVFLAAVLSISILPAGTLASETSENEVTESSDDNVIQLGLLASHNSERLFR